MTATISAYSVYYYDYNEDPPKGYGMAGRIADDGSSPVASAVAAAPNLKFDLNAIPRWKVSPTPMAACAWPSMIT